MSYINDIENLQNAILRDNPELVLKHVKNQNNALARTKIYTEGYRARLYKVLTTDFPATTHYLTEQKIEKYFFDFIEQTPSKYYNIDFYSLDFPEWFKTKSNNYKAYELLKLEAVINKIFTLPDSQSLNPEEISKLPAEEFGNYVFKQRTASMLIEFENNVEEYLSNFREEKPLEKIPESKIYMNIVRHNNYVQRILLEEQEYNFLKILLSDVSFDNAVESFNKKYNLSEDFLAQKFQEWFKKWLENGFFRG